MKRWVLIAAVLAAGCGETKKEAATKEAAPSAPVFFTVDPATAASVSGKIVFEGKKPAAKAIDMSEETECRRLHAKGAVSEEVVVNPNATLANVFVYVKSGLDGKTFEPSKEALLVDQNGCMFRPHVLGIRAGQPMRVKNSDPVSHNIHPMPKLNREWNQQQAPQAQELEREFARAEVMIPVKCNVHAWMKSYIGVMDHPYFAVTGPDGSFELKGLPPGEYTVAAWHEKFGEQEKKVTLAAKAAAIEDFTFKTP